MSSESERERDREDVNKGFDSVQKGRGYKLCKAVVEVG